MSRTLELDPGTVKTLRERGGTWGVYQNQNFNSSRVGHIQLLRYGEGCTYQEPPERLPDTDSSINHAYVLVHKVNSSELPDDGKLEIP
jgi:hypothetical protein